jgi:hypothetical protein
MKENMDLFLDEKKLNLYRIRRCVLEWIGLNGGGGGAERNCFLEQKIIN